MTVPPHLELATLACGSLACMAYAWHRLRSRSPSRPLLAALTLLAALPVVYSLSVALGLVRDAFVRINFPLATLVAAAATLYTVDRFARRGRLDTTRQRLNALLTTLAVTTAAWCVADPELGAPLDRLTVVVAVDRSRSMDLVDDVEARLAAELRAAETDMRQEDRIGVLVFGAEAKIEEPPRLATDLPAPQRVTVGRDATDLAAAIRQGLVELPPDSAGRLVLVSDGVSTRGSPLDAASAAVIAGVPVDVVPLDQAPLSNIRVSSLRLPSKVNRGESIDLRAVVEAPKATELEVRLYRDGDLVRRGTARVAAGQDVLFLREQATTSGLARYEVRITALDSTLDAVVEDNGASGFVFVEGTARALVLEGDAEQTGTLVTALESAGFELRTGNAVTAPSTLAELAAYDVVSISDIAAKDLAPSQLADLQTYVEQLGGGLLLFGGDRSMGPGGYGKTPVEAVSPVSFDLRQSRRRASLAEVVVIDYSGSMGARAGRHTKLELANDAAVRSIELLGAGDKVGVLHVDTEATWTVTMTDAADPGPLGRTIRAVGPGGGGIYVDLALTTAFAALDEQDANLKHVILFSDGSDAEQMHQARSLVRRAASRHITTSVVALGKGHDVPALEQLSQIGQGRFYLIENANRLPAVFAQETIAATRSALNETPFTPRLVESSQSTRGIDFSGAPSLYGYVVTLPKPRARILLAGPEGDPILAEWSVGIGRAAAFTSDFKGRWGRAWLTWPPASQLFAQVARSIARRANAKGTQLRMSTESGQLTLRAEVTATDSRPDSLRQLVATVGGPDGFSETAELEAIGAGIYEAEWPLSRPGLYVASVVDQQSKALLGTTGAELTEGDELRPTGTDRALLSKIASATDGSVRETLAGIFLDRPDRRHAFTPLTPPLLWSAACFLLAAVATRRLTAPTRLPARVRSLGRRLTRKWTTPPPRTPTQTTDALLTSRARRRRPEGTHAPMRTVKTPVVSSPSAVEPASAPQSPAAATDASPPSRQRTAAEVLLERRKRRR